MEPLINNPPPSRPPQRPEPPTSLENASRPAPDVNLVSQGTAQKLWLLRRDGIVAICTLAIAILAISLLTAGRHHTAEVSNLKQSVPEQSVVLSGGDIKQETSLQLQSSSDALVVNGDLLARGNVRIYDQNHYAQFQAKNLTGNRFYNLPDSSGTLCLDSNNCNYVTNKQLNQLSLKPGANGAQGPKGDTGDTGPQGPAGSNGSGCGFGCVSLQPASPGIPDVGNANITGILIAGSFSGNGANITNVNAAALNGQPGSFYTNASNISSGTLADGRLSVNVTLQGNAFNAAGQLVQLNGSGQLPAVSGALVTNLNASNVSSGTLNDLRLSSNVTLQGNIFNGASQLVLLNASTQLPAVSGALLTNLNASNVASGTLNDARLSANVTVQGNTFNGASQLVQLNGSTQLPAVSGLLVTNLNASNVASGTLNDGRLSANVALLAGTGPQTFTGNNKFTGTILFQNTANSTTAFQIQNATGTSNLLIADTTNSRVGIGKAPTLGTLDVNGAIYQSGNQVCDTSGNCAGVAGIGGSGTPGTISLFTGSGFTIGDSNLAQSGATVTNTGTFNSTTAIQTNGTTRIDNTGSLTNINTLSLGGSISGGTTYTGSGNINTTGGAIQTNGTTRIDNSGNLTNIGNLGLSGTISGGTTVTGSGNFNSTGGSLQTNSTTRVDNSGNLTNIGNLTTTGASTFATTGANGFTFKAGTDNTATFQVQNAASAKTILAVDSSNNQIVLGNAGVGGITGQITFNFAGAAGSTTLSPLTPGASNFSLNLPAENGTLCSTGSICAGYQASGSYANTTLSNLGATSINASLNYASGSSNFDQSASTGTFKTGSGAVSLNGDTTVASGKNFTQTGGGTFSTGTGTNSLNGATTIAANKLFNALGAALFQPATDSTTAFQIQNATGTSNLLIADTTNSRVGIGKAPTLGTLDVNGAIYQSGNQVCDTSGNCAGVAGIGGSGTPGTISLFTGSGFTIGDSNLAQSGATVTNTGTFNSTTAIQTNGTTRIDNTGSLTNINTLSLGGSISGGTTYTGSGNINTTGGAIQTNGTTRIDNSGNLTNIGSVTASGNVNTTGGAFQINGTSINVAGTLSNVAYLNGTGPQTFTGNNKFTGTVLSKNASDSTAALQVQNAAGNSVLTADTTNNKVIVNELNFAGVGNASQVVTKDMTVTAAVSANDVVIIDTANPGQVTTTSTANSNKVYGIATATHGAGVTQSIAILGVYQVNVDATSTINVGDFIATSATTGEVTTNGNPAAGTILGRALSAVTVPGAGQTVWVQITPDVGGGSAGSGITSIGAIDSQPKTADGGAVAGTSIYFQTADTSYPGLVSIGSQSFAGAKTFTGDFLSQDASNSTTAFQIQDSAGTSNLFIADTTNGRVGIGKTPTLGVLDVNGAIYQSGNQVCDTSGNCVGGGGGGAIGGGGTTGTIPVFTGSGFSIGDSNLVKSGSTVTETGTFNATTALQTNGTTRIDNTGSLTNINTLSLGGSISGGTTYTGSGNINSTGGAIQTNSTTRIDNSGNLTNIGTETASGNINTTGGALQTNSTTRVDNSGNLTNIGNLTTTGASTFTATGSNGFTFKAGTDNTAVLQVQNASSGKSVFAVDTTNNQVVLGNAGASGVTGQIKFNFSGAAGSTTLSPLTPGGSNFTLNLPAENGTLCSTGSVCAGYQASGSYANTNLSNLAATSINQDLLPSGAGAHNLGSNALPWGNLFLSSAGANKAISFDTSALSTNRTITVSDNAGTLALLSPTAQQTGNLNISGTVTSGNINGQTISSSANFTGSVTAAGNFNTTGGQYQVGGSQISSANLSNDANLAKLNGTGPQTFTGNNKFTGTFLDQNAADSTTAFQIQDSVGTSNLLVADTTNTRIGIGTANPTNRLQVVETSNRFTAGGGVTSENDLVVNPSADQAYGTYEGDPTGTSHTALEGYTSVPVSSTHKIYTIQGSTATAQNDGSGDVAYIVGSTGYGYNTGSGNIGRVKGVGLYAESDAGAVINLVGGNAWTGVYGGTVANQIGLDIGAENSGGTVTNRYAILIDPPVGAATYDYGIYESATQQNYFGGNIGIGKVPTLGALDVNGNIYQSGNQVCDTSGNCVGTGGGGSIGGGGTTGTIPVFTGSGFTVGDSNLAQSGATVTNTGTFNSTTAIQTNGTTRIDNTGSLTNINNLSLGGTISGGTTITGSGNINTTGGALQTNSTTRVDNSGNLTNIGNLTTTGASTFTATGSNGFTFKAGTDNTAVLQVQNASSGKSVFAVDTTNNQVVLGNAGASGVTGQIKFNFSGAAGSTTLSPLTPGGSNFTLNLPAENGTLCSTGSVCAGYQASGSYANTNLSNLAATSINQDLLPSGAGAHNLGSNALPWGNLFLSSAGANKAISFDTSALSTNRTITVSDNAGTLALLSPTAQQTGNLNISGTVTSGNINGQTISSSANFTGSVTAAGNFNTTGGQYQVGGSQISSANLSNDANLAKLNGTGPQTFTGNNKFTGTFLDQNAADSAAALQVQNSAGSALFNVNTSTENIDTYRGNLSINSVATSSPSLSTSASGGTLSANTYYYALAAIIPGGNTVAVQSTPVSVTTTGSASKNTLTWSAVTGASGYYIYRSFTGTVSGPWFRNTLGVVTSAIDDGSTYTWSGTDYNYQLLTSAVGNLNLATGGGLYLDGASGGPGNVALFENAVNKNLTIGNYEPTGGVVFDANSFMFEDTTGYNQNFYIDNTGATAFKNRVNSTTGFQIQNAAGTSNLFIADTTNNRVGIGKVPTQGALDVNGNIYQSGYQVCDTSGNCVGGGGGGSIGGSGTAGTISLFTGSGFTIGDSNLTQSGSTVTNTGTFNSTTAIQTNGTTRIDNTGNLSNIGTVTTSGAINGQTISSSAVLTGTLAVQGTNSLALGVASSATGSALFRNSGGSGSITLSPANPGSSNYTLTLPAETGTLCSTGSVCTGYAPSTGGTGYIQNSTSLQTNANFNIQSTGTNSVTATIKQNSGQTADLFDLQNSSGNPVSAFINSGALQVSAPNSFFGYPVGTVMGGSTVFIQSTANNATALNLAGDPSELSTAMVLQVAGQGGGRALSVFGNNRVAVGGNISSPQATLHVLANATNEVAAIIQGQGSQTADLLDIQTSTPTNVFTVGASGAVLSKNSANSTTAFQVQNSSSGSLFNVDTSNNNLTLNGVDSGQTGAWTNQSSNKLPVTLGGMSSVQANGYAYVVGGFNGTSYVKTVYYAKLNTDGSTGAWTSDANQLPAERGSSMVVTVNGYIYAIGGFNLAGNSTTTVYYAKINSDGSTGVWQTQSSNPLPQKHGLSGAVAYNGYVYILGGYNDSVDTNTVYYAKANADGTLGTWVNQGSNLISIPIESAGVTTANGYVYMFGGYDNNTGIGNVVLYAKLNSNGGTGAWTSQGSNLLPDNTYQPVSAVMNGYAYVIGGTDASSTARNSVYYAKLNADGSTGAWTSQASNLMATATSSASSVVANGYIYAFGGGSGGSTNNVQYASTSRIQIGGSIDLVGLSGGTLADGGSQSSGSPGGSVTAGNILAVGDLQVQGETDLNGNLFTRGNLNAGGSALFQAPSNSTTAFQIQNAAGTSFLKVDTQNQGVTLGRTNVGAVTGNRVFTDNFETGGYGFDLYNSVVGAGSPVLDTSTVFAGRYSAKINTATTQNYAEKNISNTGGTMYARGYVYIASASSKVGLFGLYNSTDGFVASEITVYRNAGGNITVWSGPGGVDCGGGGGALSTGVWHKIELKVVISNTGSCQLWVDDSMVMFSGTVDTLATTTNPDRFYFGTHNTSETATTYFDEFAVDTQAVDNAGSATVQDTLHVGGTATFAGNVLAYGDTTDGIITAGTGGTNGYSGILRTRNSGLNGIDIMSNSSGVAGSTFGVANGGASFIKSNLELAIGTTTAASLDFATNGSQQATIASGGATTFKNSTNSTAAFQVQNSSGSSFFTADSANQIITAKDQNIGGASNVGSAGRLFSDSFESGNFNLWNQGITVGGSSTVTADSATVRNGKYSARFSSSNGANMVRTSVNGATTTMARAYVYVTSDTSGAVDLMYLGNSGTNKYFGLYRDDSTGKLTFWNDVTSSNTLTSAVMSMGTWHEIEYDLTINASTGSVTVYMDGNNVLTSTNINTGSANPDTLQLAGGNTSRTYVLNMDDVTVDTVRPGDSASLNVADSLHVSGTSTFGNSALFQPKYNSPTAFQIQNSSGASLLTADTSNLILNVGGNLTTGSSFGSRLFSDGFESGNFNLWSGGTWTSGGGSNNITADSSLKRSGKYSAKINASSGSAAVDANINPSTTVSMRTYVYISSATTGLDILSCDYSADNGHNMGGMSYNQATGKLAVTWSNSTGNHTADGSATMTTGAWHEVELTDVVNASTGSLNMYLDGTNVESYSGDTGSKAFNICELGEGNTRTGTYYADDVAIDTAYTGVSATANISDSLHVAGTSSFGNNVLIQPASNSTTAFQVQNNSNNNILGVDTLNGHVTAGNPTVVTPVQEWDAHSTNQATVSVSPQKVGDLMTLAVQIGGGKIVTGVSGGGVSNWTRVNYITGARQVELWEGTVTSTGASTITATYSGSPSVTCELVAQEFTAGLGANTIWSVAASKTLDNSSSSTVTYPTLTTSQVAQLYWGFAWTTFNSTAGSTPGFTYVITGNNNQVAYDQNTGANTAYGPTGSQTSAGTSTSAGMLISAYVGSSLNVNGAATITGENSTSAFQIQNAAGTNLVTLDSTTDPTNLLTNGSFEQDTSGWAVKGSSTISRITSSPSPYIGMGSLQIATTAAANDGAQYTYTFAPSTQYTLTVYSRASSGANFFTVGRQDQSGTDIDCLTGQWDSTAGWRVYTCTFTTGATISGSSIYVKQNDTSSRNFYIDAVKLQTGSGATPYREAGISLNANITSPLTINNLSDSHTALQVVDSSGYTDFAVSTATASVGIGTNAPTRAALDIRGGSIALQNGNSLKIYTADDAGAGTYLTSDSGNSTYLENVYNNLYLQTDYSGGHIYFRHSGSNVVDIGSGGSALFQNSSDSTTAFQIQNTSSNKLLNADTLNGQVTIGSSLVASSINNWGNHATNLATLAVSPATNGNLMVLGLSHPNGVTVTAVSGGGVTNWVKVTSINDASTSGITDLWEGTVTSTGSSTITVTYSGTPGSGCELVAQEFSAGLGANTVWSVNTSNTIDNTSSTTLTYPTMTAAQSGSLYWAFGVSQQSGGAGSTSGFSWLHTSDGNEVTYNTNAQAGTSYSPTGTNTPAALSNAAGMIISATAGSTLNVNSAEAITASNTDTNTQQLQIKQNGTGDAAQSFQNASTSFYQGLDSTDNNFKINSKTAATTIGITGTGDTTDSGNNGLMSAQLVYAGGVAGGTETVSSISVYTPVIDGTNKHMQVAVYDATGSQGNPGNRVAFTGSQVLSTGWNTFNISATLNTATKYYLVFNVDGAATQYGEWNENIGWHVVNTSTFGTWPSTFGTPTGSNNKAWSIYATLSLNNAFDNPLISLGPTGNLQIQQTDQNTNSSALSVLDAFGGKILSVDTVGESVNITSGTGQEAGLNFFNSDGTSQTFYIKNDINNSVTHLGNRNGNMEFDSNGHTVFRPRNIGSSPPGDTTNMFDFQNNAGNTVLDVDTTGGQIVLGKASTLNGAIQFQSSSNSNTVALKTSTSGLLLQPSSDSAAAFQIQNATGSSAFNVGTLGEDTLLTNNSFEGSSVSTWTYSGAAGGSVARDTTQYYLGSASLKVITGSTAAAFDGVKGAISGTLSTSTTYSVTWYDKITSGSFTDVIARFSYDGTTGNESSCTSINTQIVSTAGWTRHSCQFTTGSGGTAPTSSNAIFIVQQGSNGGTQRTFFVDAVQLQTGTGAIAFKDNSLSLFGQITSPLISRQANDSTTALQIQYSNGADFIVADSLNGTLTTRGYATFKPWTDSTTAFQIQNSGGTNAFTVDTTNNKITLATGSGSTGATVLVLGIKTDAGDPGTCTNGGMYYNSNSNAFRACQNSAWVNMISAVSITSYTSGDNTYSIPGSATAIQIILVGGGGGGGGGANRATSNERDGGGGGGGGAYSSQILAASDIAASPHAAVGSAGSSGSAGTGGGNGGNAGAGGNSCFSSAANCTGTIYAQAFGGGGGAGGANTSTAGGGGGGGGTLSAGANATTGNGGSGGSPGAAFATDAAGGGGGSGAKNKSLSGGIAAGNAEYGGGGGGGGGSGTDTVNAGGSSGHGGAGGGGGSGVSAANAVGTAAAGGTVQAYSVGGGGSAGTSGGTCTNNAGAGVGGNTTKAGTGGGGGGSSSTNNVAGCVGGAGGGVGGGGGGGGAGTGTGNGGAGGGGGAGEIWIIAW